MPAILLRVFSNGIMLIISIIIVVLIAIFIGQISPHTLDFEKIDTGAILHRRSYFYVGGEYTSAKNSAILFGQMYVEHLVPIKVTQPFPIIFIPGNGGCLYIGLYPAFLTVFILWL